MKEWHRKISLRERIGMFINSFLLYHEDNVLWYTKKTGLTPLPTIYTVVESLREDIKKLEEKLTNLN